MTRASKTLLDDWPESMEDARRCNAYNSESCGGSQQNCRHTPCLTAFASQNWLLKHHIGKSSSAAPKKRSDTVQAFDIDIRKTLFEHKITPKAEDRFIQRTNYLMSFSILPIRCTTSGSRSFFTTWLLDIKLPILLATTTSAKKVTIANRETWCPRFRWGRFCKCRCRTAYAWFPCAPHPGHISRSRPMLMRPPHCWHRTPTFIIPIKATPGNTFLFDIFFDTANSFSMLRKLNLFA